MFQFIMESLRYIKYCVCFMFTICLYYTMKPSLLYKIHEDNDCDTLLCIVQYLYAKGMGDFRPITIIERNMPKEIKVLPTIVINNQTIEGLQNIVCLYEKITNVDNLIDEANKFHSLNPNYRITDNSTHKNIRF